ncbi:hypothetical protein RND81_12G182800 [Saponaria officinalis]|uniref:AN1-type domain-containing protein n=1 Tax=Saponaria officinalis TaxID=3572 RepID=A0AAW1HCC8_SAPOF
MAQNREKDETIELKVPSDSPLSLSCPDTTCKNLPGFGIGLDPTRVDRRDTSCPRSDEARPHTEERKRVASDSGSSGEPAKRAVNRCSGCRKRVGLTGFRCRCGDLFCADHRYSDRHDCPYDYKSEGRAAIARENPVVKAAKIQKV